MRYWFAVICAVVVALATACAIVMNETIYTIICVVLTIIIWTISAISSKELSPRSIYKWAISKWRLRQCKRRHCSDEEKRLIEEKIDKLKADIAKYEDSALSAWNLQMLMIYTIAPSRCTIRPWIVHRVVILWIACTGNRTQINETRTPEVKIHHGSPCFLDLFHTCVHIPLYQRRHFYRGQGVDKVQ